MKIFNQLSDDQLTDLVLEGDEQHLREPLAALPEFARVAADRPQGFWHQQRMTIHTRISASQKRGLQLLPLLGSAVAIVLLAFGMLTPTRHHPVPTQAQADPDPELLLQVEDSLQDNGPEALQPAATLAQEISENTTNQASGSNRTKEKNTHEN